MTVMKGVRNGLVYGAKIRFPHAFVMTFLFRDQLPLRAKLRAIFEATMQHSKNLGTFVGIYKTLLIAMRRSRQDGKEQVWDAFLSGLVGGYMVFGKDNGINQQVSPYRHGNIIPRLFYTCFRAS